MRPSSVIVAAGPRRVEEDPSDRSAGIGEAPGRSTTPRSTRSLDRRSPPDTARRRSSRRTPPAVEVGPGARTPVCRSTSRVPSRSSRTTSSAPSGRRATVGARHPRDAGGQGCHGAVHGGDPMNPPIGLHGVHRRGVSGGSGEAQICVDRERPGRRLAQLPAVQRPGLDGRGGHRVDPVLVRGEEDDCGRPRRSLAQRRRPPQSAAWATVSSRIVHPGMQSAGGETATPV